MPHRGTETEFELTTIGRLEGRGYIHLFGPDLARPAEEVVLRDVLAAFLADLIHDVVGTIKRNLKVDWTEPHRSDVKAAVQAAVKRVLRRRKVREENFDPFLTCILTQAEALYAHRPVGECDRLVTA